MVSLETQKFEQGLRERLGRFINTDSKKVNLCLYEILNEIRNKKYPAFLCGGAVRDILLHNSIPRDLDIILGDISNSQLRTLFSPYVKGETGLGGIKLQIKDWSVDMWVLQNTWAFKHGKFAGKDFSDYPKITFLNIDAIAVQLFSKRGKKREIHSKGFFEAISTKTIELNFEENPAPAICIAKALHIANKFHYAFGPKLARYVMFYAKQMEIEEMTKIYQHRYVNASVTLEKLHNCIKNIGIQLNISSRSPVKVIL